MRDIDFVPAIDPELNELFSFEEAPIVFSIQRSFYVLCVSKFKSSLFLSLSLSFSQLKWFALCMPRFP